MYVESVNLNIGELESFELGTFQVGEQGQVLASVTLHGSEVRNVVTAVELELPIETVEQIRTLLLAELNDKFVISRP